MLQFFRSFCERYNLPSVLLLVGLFGFVIGMWIIVGFLPALNLLPGFDFSKQGEIDAALPGQFGDSFGWINSVFTALAFAGVLVTLLRQRTELQLQREEMRLTREELQTTREEHARSAKAQEKSESRLFLAAYMNALEFLRQLSQWRMSADPARTQYATYPVVEGLVVQARVSQSLQLLVRELEPEIRQIHTSLTSVTEVGSNVWCLEELLGVHLGVRNVVGSHSLRFEDASAFEEAINIVKVQTDRLESVKRYCGADRIAIISRVLNKSPGPNIELGKSPPGDYYAVEARRKYFEDLKSMNAELLSAIMTICFE